MILEVVCPIPVAKSFDYTLPIGANKPSVENMIGRRVRISFGFRSTVGVVKNVKETSDAPLDKLKPATQFLDAEPLLTPEMIQLGAWLSERYACSLGEALFQLMPPGRENPRSFKDPAGGDHHDHFFAGEPKAAYSLTKEQTAAAQVLHGAVFDHASRAFLLYGVAAAGKTEVYMGAIKDALSQGKTALYLAPEIGLAIQTADVLRERFGEKSVLLFHSDVAPKKRMEDWWRIKRGEFPVVIGARSAVLAPLPNLGVIIVDEEHDTAYKEDRKPRFHARDVALTRAKASQAVCVLGSATPSLEMMQAGTNGDVGLIELTERAIPASAPHVTLVDVTKERFRGAVSISLQKAIDDRLKKNQQTILFLNKRGFHRFLRCPECSWVARCPDCAIALVYHKDAVAGSGYWCHYCSHKTGMPAHCPECRHKKLFSGGFGTQRIAEEIKERFPWARVLRWDRDSVSHQGDQQKIYEKFSRESYDILIGTQMVAQGFNFPRVTLVGVMDADSPLHLPDFRAAEHTFQMITQVAGRAGRAMVAGEVLVQTRHPDHYAIRYAHKLDYKGFAETELTFRKEFHYPPFGHLIQVLSTSKKPKQAEDDIQKLADWADAREGALAIGILGPSPARRQKKGLHRIQILFKIPTKKFPSFLADLRHFLTQQPNRYTVDVDPETIH